jgi:WD40 repeat protein
MDLRKGSIIQQFEQVRPVRMGDPPRNPNSLHSCKTVFSADGRRSFSYSIKGGALWDTETGQQLQLVESAPVGAATFTTDGKQVIYVIETPKILKSVNLENGNTWQVPLGKWGITTVLTTSSDDKTLLIGHYQGAVRALDLTTFQWKWQVIKHLRPVRSLAMTRDGRTAISCSADGLVLVWDVVNGRHVHSFNVGQNIRAATMSPDGTRIISSSGDGTSSRVWDLARLPGLRPPQKELQAAWARLREDPKDARAAAVCAKWYIDSDCSDWAQRTLAAVDGDVAGAKQVISARTLWLSGQNAAAVEAFSQLRQKSSAVEDQQYLALCAFAAAQENRR